jgi:hypothetical protein
MESRARQALFVGIVSAVAVSACAGVSRDDSVTQQDVTTASCNKNVLVLADAPTEDLDSATAGLRDALAAAGLTPTVIANGVQTFTGAESGTTFGAVLVTPSSDPHGGDMPVDGQRAIVAANAAGAGVVFTEWSSWRVHDQKFQVLAPLTLLEAYGFWLTTLVFSPVVFPHPVWDGLPTSASVDHLMIAGRGIVTHDGVEIAQVMDYAEHDPSSHPDEFSPGVVVREATPDGGRVVHLAVAGAFHDPEWVKNAPAMKMVTNSVAWAARCR